MYQAMPNTHPVGKAIEISIEFCLTCFTFYSFISDFFPPGGSIKVLKRMWDLKAEILMFFSMKDISCDFSKQM